MIINWYCLTGNWRLGGSELLCHRDVQQLIDVFDRRQGGGFWQRGQTGTLNNYATEVLLDHSNKQPKVSKLMIIRCLKGLSLLNRRLLQSFSWVKIKTNNRTCFVQMVFH